MSIAWLLKDLRVTSVLTGASSVSQLKDNLQALKNITFTDEELELIDKTAGPVMM
jgi:L-glyceraldehyde 3-phosphate reductase